MTGFYYKRQKEKRKKERKKPKPIFSRYPKCEDIKEVALSSKYFYYRSAVGYNIAKCLNVEPVNKINQNTCLNLNAFNQFNGLSSIGHEVFNWDHLNRFASRKKYHIKYVHYLQKASKVYDFSLMNLGLYSRYGIEFNFCPLEVFEAKNSHQKKRYRFFVLWSCFGKKKKSNSLFKAEI